MADAPFMPLYTRDIIADVQGLTAEQFGAYMRLLIAQWNSGAKPLIDDDGYLSRVAGLSMAKWRSSRPILEGYFDITDEGWISNRLKKEWQKFSEKREILRANASKGGKAKSLKGKETGLAKGTDLLLANACQNPAKSEVRSHNRKNTKKDWDDDEQFSDLWDHYPKQRPGSKEKAFKAYLKAKERASPDEIIRGVKAYAQSDEVKNGYAKGAAAWLNDDRWTSEYAPANQNQSHHDPAKSLREARLRDFHESGRWRAEWGPRPDEKKEMAK